MPDVLISRLLNIATLACADVRQSTVSAATSTSDATRCAILPRSHSASRRASICTSSMGSAGISPSAAVSSSSAISASPAETTSTAETTSSTSQSTS